MIITLLMLGFLLVGALAWFLQIKKLAPARVVVLISTFILSLLFIGSLVIAQDDFSQLVVITSVPWISFFNINYSEF